ncbi:PEP/pyruvate-binding domain-containing protein [Candidatus Nanohalococcus occultus]|uniref:Pyruvate phosphate dikinase AMP/ATP-binding domain-containing protein n=1 Tax=Candidatus Nanohalococcus occultus TaxID=2978047 RepID=A0ABY8CI69_9ARCH|nr:hypothetical protein SVXNc_0565 [Candidatus Nanohaloarchaeota archaeon SVXNc]
MVVWKGETSREKCGEKAVRLDSADDLNIPNFFVITKQEIQQLVGDSANSREVLNKQFSSDFSNQLREAYKEVDMSSAVRNASGPARNLVGGQRSGSRVSVRISDDSVSEYKLNVGESDLGDAVKEVLASYFEENSEMPAVIVQRMIEPEASGAVILNYTEDHALVEAVKGLGTSIEEGVTVPEFYLVNDSVEDRRIPDSQLEDSLNLMTGEIKRRKTDRNHFIFSESELVSFVNRLRAEGYSGKFVYKRGTFYVTDLFEKSDGSAPADLDGITVTKQKVQNRGFRKTEDTVPPEEYERSLISEKGGYTSTDAEKARRAGKRAVFSFKGEIEEENKEYQSMERQKKQSSTSQDHSRRETAGQEKSVLQVTGTESVPLNAEGGLSLSPPFDGKYAVTSRNVRGRAIDPESYVSSCEQLLTYEGDQLVLDARNISSQAAEKALGLVEADFKILIVNPSETGLIGQAVRKGFDAIASNSPETVRSQVLREEKKLLLDHARKELE